MLGKTKKYLRALALVVVAFCDPASAQNPPYFSYPFSFEHVAESIVTILQADGSSGGGSAGAAKSQPLGSGLVVRSDGYILTAHHLVKGARGLQVRLHNGEIYDHAEVVSADERRNVALVRVKVGGLRVIPGSTAEESLVGTKIFVASVLQGQTRFTDSVLNSVQLADTIPGAGSGYRVLQFKGAAAAAAAAGPSAGGLLLDEKGRSLGVVTTNPDVKNQDIAVPLSSISGLINSAPLANSSTASSVYLPASSPPPAPQPAKSPAPAETRKLISTNPRELLLNSKIVYVNSRTTFFKEHQLINELNKRDLVKQWGWLFVDGYWGAQDKADLIIDLDHQIFTYNFTFTVRHRETSIILAAGKVIIWDGASGAPKMTDRIVEKLKEVRKDNADAKNAKGKDKDK